MTRIGDNGGPPMVPLTAKTKLECIKQVLERRDLTPAQKCIGAMMIVQADKEWSAEIKTADLQQAASAKDRETVFRATRTLDEKGIIAKSSARGQSGRYVVLPPRIVEAVLEAYESGRVDADHSDEKWSGETGRDKWSVPTTQPVGLDPTASAKVVGLKPTSRVKPVGFEPTGPVEADHSPRARVEYNNINNIYNNNNNIHTELEAAREGEENAGCGVFVNCETVRHRDFTISLKAIELQLCGTVPLAEIKQVALGHALQWALDIEAGKSAAKVLPSNTASFIRGSIQNQRNNSAVTDVRKQRASSKHAPRPDGKTFAELNDEVLAELEKGRRR